MSTPMRFGTLTIIIALAALACSACNRQATIPMQPTVMGSSPAPELGLVVNQALRVEDVVAGGAAAAGGIQPGDVLFALDGQPLIEPAEWRRALLEHEQGKPVQLTIRRDSEERTIAVTPAQPASRPGDATATPVPAELWYL